MIIDNTTGTNKAIIYKLDLKLHIIVFMAVFIQYIGLIYANLLMKGIDVIISLAEQHPPRILNAKVTTNNIPETAVSFLLTIPTIAPIIEANKANAI